MDKTSVSEIHRYLLKPEGLAEPLWPTPTFKQAVMDHLLEAPWLSRASELARKTGEVVHAREEPVRLVIRRGRTELVRERARRRCGWRRRPVVRVLDRWREVKEWWDEERRTDRLLFRILLCGGEIVDLARERSGGWTLVGVVD
jgi:hypothetical protein